MTPFDPKNIQTGKPLPVGIYNSEGKRVFRKGFVINSQNSLKQILKMELFTLAEGVEEQINLVSATGVYPVELANALPADHEDTPVESKNTDIDVARFIEYAVRLSESICKCIATGAVNQKLRLESLIKSVLQMYAKNEDACIAFAHFHFNFPMSAMHPVYTTLLCASMGSQLSKDRLRSLIGAALTANLGMYLNFDTLINSNSPLSEEEFQILKEHPQKSYDLLKNNGITDTVWLDAVLQHHERSNGSGYPKKLTDVQITLEAKIIAMVDTYLALTMPRAYRQPIMPKQAIQSLYQIATKENNRVAVELIKQLGVYPPGSLVKLKNDEVAVVLKRNVTNRLAPMVASVFKTGQGLFDAPVIRDTGDRKYIILDSHGAEIVKNLDLRGLWSDSKIHTVRLIRG